MHPTDIIEDKSYLTNFVPVPATHLQFVYIGMFIAYVDNQLHRGGFVYKVLDNNDIVLSSTNEQVDVTQLVTIDIKTIQQFYKKIDFCFFELYELEHNRLAKLCDYIKSLEERIKMLEMK